MRADARLQARAGIPVLAWPALEESVDHAVTTSYGGVSSGPYTSLNLAMHVGDDPGSVIENRRRAAAAVGAELDDLVMTKQVHGTDRAVIERGHRGAGALEPSDAVADADIMVTTEHEPVLTVLVADCVPVMLFDASARVLATVHAGWRGTCGGAVAAAIEAMVDLGAERHRIRAALGPAVSPERYVVGADVASAAEAALGDESAAVLLPHGDGQWLFDLVGANCRLLATEGVSQPRIHTSGIVTGEANLFFSHRARRPCGRFALLARLRPS